MCSARSWRKHIQHKPSFPLGCVPWVDTPCLISTSLLTLLLSCCQSRTSGLSLMRFYLCTQVIVLRARKDSSGSGVLSKQPGPSTHLCQGDLGPALEHGAGKDSGPTRLLLSPPSSWHLLAWGCVGKALWSLIPLWAEDLLLRTFLQALQLISYLQPSRCFTGQGSRKPRKNGRGFSWLGPSFHLVHTCCAGTRGAIMSRRLELSLCPQLHQG